MPEGSGAGRGVVCLPTYNERENLARMVEAVGSLRPALVRPLDVLVIDDASPDGTGAIADSLAAERDWVHVLHRPGKAGLGQAYLAGFAWALERGYDLVLEMDCDFSHDPARIPALVAAVDGGADLALGSRYVRGGGVADWPLARRVISRGGCLYAQVVLGVRVRDLTGGFKCFRSEALASIPFDRVRAGGYAFQIEMTYRALCQGRRIVEVPITFTDRVAGGSKMSRAIVLEAIWRVPLLRLRRLTGRL